MTKKYVAVMCKLLSEDESGWGRDVFYNPNKIEWHEALERAQQRIKECREIYKNDVLEWKIEIKDWEQGQTP